MRLEEGSDVKNTTEPRGSLNNEVSCDIIYICHDTLLFVSQYYIRGFTF
jgi:hypothetical protein